MKNYVIFALLALFACSEDTKTESPCLKVTFSDALPVQFWLNDCPTYNETVPKGVHYKCFCHPWHCDDEIKVQFTDSDVDEEYYLSVKDDNDTLLDSIPFYKDIHRAVIELNNYEFSSTLSPWSNVGSGQDWQWDTFGGGSAEILLDLLGSGNNVSKELNESYSFDAGKTYTFTITGESGLFISFAGIKIKLINTTTAYSITSSENFVGSTFETVFTVTPTQNCNQISIIATNNSTLSSIVLNLFKIETVVNTLAIYTASFIPADNSICDTSVKMEVINSSSPESVIAKTDCILITSNEDEPTVLFEYSNNRNLAGLVYESVSPETVFQIRIPAIFFHERFPEEDEAIELSDSKIINLNGVVRAQRMLETDYMPYYMHRKMKLILKHQTLLADGLYWTKQDAYEISDGDRRWPVRKASCYLTERDFVQRNVV